MQVFVTFRNIEGTEALREHALAKLRRVSKFMRRPVEAHVVLAVNKHRHVAEVTVMANRMTFNAVEETDDLYSAIDVAMSKLERQVKKHSAKRQARKHEATAQTRIEEHEPPVRVTTERVAIKPMSVREAIQELNATRAEFLLFQNTESDTLNVVYRRRGGAYSVVEPEVD